MMCAAHVSDLHAARNCGLRTGFIYRPNEFAAAVRPEYLTQPNQAILTWFPKTSSIWRSSWVLKSMKGGDPRVSCRRRLEGLVLLVSCALSTAWADELSWHDACRHWRREDGGRDLCPYLSGLSHAAGPGCCRGGPLSGPGA